MKSASKSAFHHLSSALFLLLLCLLATSSAFGYTGGSGTAEDPYQIANAADLLELSATTSDYDANFILTEDINLASYTFTTAVIAPNLTLDFTGSFNGAGHKISNLTIIGNINDQNMLGLFGEIGFEGEVNNLGLEGVNLEGTCVDYGGLAARNNGKIINCYSDVNIIRKCVPSYVGGLVGLNGGSLINCYTGGQIISNIIFNNCAHYDTGVGGLAGGYYGSSSISRITNCYSTVNISNTVETGDCIEGTGGLVGQGGNNIIRNCFSTGSVYGFDNVGGLVGKGSNVENSYFTGDVNGHYNVGGLVGEVAQIRKSFSTGDVNGERGVGGLVGDGGNVENSYSTGNVRGQLWVGGLGGDGVSATNCYSTGIVTGTSYFGGLIGSGSAANSYFLEGGPNNGIGTPLDGNELKQCVNFNNWDFAFNWSGLCNLGPDYIWFIFDGESYPQLYWYVGLCTVPNIVGLYIYNDDVNEKIIDRGFTVGTITYEHNDIDYGYVIRQDPEANSQPECGKAVNYTVSIGSWPCQIPNIVGEPTWYANMLIEGDNHTVGDISYVYSDTVLAGYVISQNPPPCPYKCSECGLAINYVASLGELPDNNEFPDYYDDNIVNFNDFALFADAWLTENADINLTTGDNFIDIIDLKVFCNHWLEED